MCMFDFHIYTKRTVDFCNCNTKPYSFVFNVFTPVSRNANQTRDTWTSIPIKMVLDTISQSRVWIFCTPWPHLRKIICIINVMLHTCTSKPKNYCLFIYLSADSGRSTDEIISQPHIRVDKYNIYNILVHWYIMTFRGNAEGDMIKNK